MDEELWQWVWLSAMVVFTVGELATPGSFFLAPFAAGSAVAAAAAFIGAPVAVSWSLFLVVSFAAFAALRPLARRLDAQGGNPVGVGASRLIGDTGVVIKRIPDVPGETGAVRVRGEEWSAASSDGRPIAEGATVEIVDVRGTRLVVGAPRDVRPTSPPVS